MATDSFRRRLAFATASALIATGCLAPVGVPVQPPSGVLFSLYSAPLETRFDATPVGSKRGTAQLHFLREPFYNIPLLTWGDASLEAAAADAGIQEIHYADYQLLTVVGIYVQFEVRVYGE